MNLTDMPNIGPVLAANLTAAGIRTPEQLTQIGAEEAFARIRSTVDPGACLHMLYGIQGAIDGVPDSKLPETTKDRLRRFYREL